MEAKQSKIFSPSKQLEEAAQDQSEENESSSQTEEEEGGLCQAKKTALKKKQNQKQRYNLMHLNVIQKNITRSQYKRAKENLERLTKPYDVNITVPRKPLPGSSYPQVLQHESEQFETMRNLAMELWKPYPELQVILAENKRKPNENQENV